MIGVIYAPKPDQPEEEPPSSRQEQISNGGTQSRTPGTPAGERKMNVVRGGSMFVRKEPVKDQVSWSTWLYNQVVGEQKKETAAGSGTVGVVGGGGQSNVVVKTLKGLSETVFGF